MKYIIALTDYKNKFGSKHFDEPYRSGFNKEIINQEFKKHGYEISFVQFSHVFNSELLVKRPFILYTSSEDINYLYKSYIEDIILTLQEQGFKVIPQYRFLRANNNKVFMELLRSGLDQAEFKTINSQTFGTVEEFFEELDKINFPIVVKKAAGASGSGVFKASNGEQAQHVAKTVSKSVNLFYDFWDLVRSKKHPGYIRESRHRNKFIVQNFIPNLKNDWKVYFFGDKYYVFFRPILKHRGFRASGGGYDNYYFGEKAQAPIGMLDYAERFIENFDVPHASLDIAFDGDRFHIIEFQFLYFGTAGIPYSDGYFQRKANEWSFIKKQLSIEEVYVNSIIKYIEKK